MTPKNPIAQEIQAKVSRAFGFGNKITFCWVPSHCNIVGNEIADKQAAIFSKKTTRADLPIVAKDLNPYIDGKGKIWLQNQWDFYDQNKLHLVDSKIGVKKFHTFETRLEEIKYNRIRLGHTRLTNSHHAGGEEPPICNQCNEQITIRHIFTTCPLYDEARKRFFGENHKNMPKILSRESAENCYKVINFLKYTKLYKEI